MRFKKWIPGIMLGAMMAAKVTLYDLQIHIHIFLLDNV